MHTQPDLHTKAQQNPINNENTQEGGSETNNVELIEETKDITHLLKKANLYLMKTIQLSLMKENGSF